MRKLRFPAEAAYVMGILLMAAGVACVSRSSFGYSMIVAPVYLLYTKLGFASFGTVEYLWQGLLLAVMCVAVRRFRVGYLFSFVTAVLYGYTLDACLWAVGHIGAAGIASRAVLFVLGTLSIATAITFAVRTYLAPEVYELFVKEVSDRYRLPFGRVKLGYDLINLVLSVVLSLALFGGGVFRDFSFAALGRAILDGYVIEGIGIGTVIAALVNGPLIGVIGRFFDRVFDFRPLFPRAAEWFGGRKKTGETPQA